jgi:hypothetical protein
VLGEITRRLKSEPLEFGEALFDLKSLGMQVRVGIQLPVAIHFGVDAKNKLVIVQTAAILF